MLFLKKVMKHTGLRDAEFAWYSLSVTWWIFLSSLEHSIGIYSFRPSWPCLIIEVLATWAKFIQPSVTFHLSLSKCFGCFCGIMAQFEQTSPLAEWIERSPMAQETGIHSQVKSYQTQKMVLDTSLLNTQHYKVHIKGKVEQSKERSSTLPYTSV